MNIGILASGGDGAGMNYCLFNLYKYLYKNNKVILFNRGYKGLIENDILNFDYKFLNKHKNDGGIILQTSRCPEFKTEEGKQKGIDTIKENNIDCLIVLGGNGSLRGAQELKELGINVMFIPCTIDNDVAGSEYCIGFNTACYNCTSFVLHVNDTMKSFNRTCIYEAMGRECPQIAIEVAKKVNASYAYIDETCTQEKCIQTLKESLKTNDAPIVILRENLINILDLKQKIINDLKVDVRTCIVGYVQRGGKPTKIEKNYAKNFAKNCANQINNNNLNKAIIVKNSAFCAVDITKIA